MDQILVSQRITHKSKVRSRETFSSTTFTAMGIYGFYTTPTGKRFSERTLLSLWSD